NPPLTADAAPRINGRPIILSNSCLFFRTSEASLVRQAIERVPLPDNHSGEVISSISPDGRFIAFEAKPWAWACGSNRDIYVFDRQQCMLQPDSVAQTQNSGESSVFPSLSAEGRVRAFIRKLTNESPVEIV